ncbi:MAG: diaminopimelate decarboxylase [Deltaproteobacteria bacterium]|nr:diaminopimelate decarboxylase [Deltaproteobacteria bacterium]
MDAFHYRNKELFCEDVAVREIAEKIKTPVFIYSENYLKQQFLDFSKTFSEKHIICFAVKANNNLSLLKILSNLGSGADIVSGGELYISKKANIPSSKIVFAGAGKEDWEIEYALDKDILMFNVESLSELKKINKIACSKKEKARIAVRVNPEIDPKTHPYISTGLKKNKFGVPYDEALNIYQHAKGLSCIDVAGIHFHIGSQLTDLSPLRESSEKIFQLVLKLKEKDINIRYIDVGGGLGITYKDEKIPSLNEYKKAIVSAFSPLRDEIVWIFEPGRFLAGNSAILVVKVLYKKENGAKRFLITNGGMNDLIRPALYNAYHEILPVITKKRNKEKMDVVGPICESCDFLAQERFIEDVEEGEYLAVHSCGAYGFSMSSNYNARLKACEVLVNGKNWRIIRRRESLEDLTAYETD